MSAANRDIEMENKYSFDSKDKKSNSIIKPDCISSLAYENIDCKAYEEKSIQEKNIQLPRKSIWEGYIKIYKRRYVMLFIFALSSMMNGLPQFQYVVVADVVACYYNTSLEAINWTSLIFMVAFLPLFLPITYLIDKKGLKVSFVFGALFNFLGSLVQCTSFAPTRFISVMVASTLYSIAEVFILSLPPVIAGVWFGPDEVGLACALGVFGNQLGIGLGFIIPPLVMTNNCKDDVDITKELSIIGYSMTGVNFVILILAIFVFEAKPEKFPSIAQAAKKSATNYLSTVKSLVLDFNFMLLFLSYGLLTGTYFSISTILNEMILIHFPGAEQDAGWLGAIMVFVGMVGSIIFGALLDRTRKYKAISLFKFAISFMLMVGYMFLVRLKLMWILYIIFTLFGFFMTAYIPTGFDFGAEITYPIPEIMSGSLLNASTQLFSIILTNIAVTILEKYGDFSSNIFFCCSLALAIVLMAFLKYTLKRTDASKDES